MSSTHTNLSRLSLKLLHLKPLNKHILLVFALNLAFDCCFNSLYLYISSIIVSTNRKESKLQYDLSPPYQVPISKQVRRCSVLRFSLFFLYKARILSIHLRVSSIDGNCKPNQKLSGVHLVENCRATRTRSDAVYCCIQIPVLYSSIRL